MLENLFKRALKNSDLDLLFLWSGFKFACNESTVEEYV
jgi:hypothetical protein